EVQNGVFPAWYAPVQLVVLPVGEADAEPAYRFAEAAADLRVEVVVDGSLAARVRDARRVPFVAVIGPREAAGHAVSLRRHGDDPVEYQESEALAVMRRSAALPLP